MAEIECLVQRFTFDEDFFIYIKVDGKFVGGFSAPKIAIKHEHNCAVLMAGVNIVYADRIEFDINSDAESPIGVENNEE